ncbi:auxin-responsive protein IAA18-like [Phragmites australis]|uniref:auxin-responsive protein IAA18-like n=1 Tax=Phragmites australis TaxID=29695 RepID=UPI002D76673D|nr:auxin-responsive protein IAA18-like [Phragmites australis]XP_062231932.1 auxin-responsive protein IAA18-like [Phragmites australis]XP_062231933.1 auxin-responsive protein IAA18-like [Phragmites australis]XP_062231934.1 auxin-responsive protein IAA18-like [Phragmites australis]
MGEDSKERASIPQLINLIRDEGEWKVREAKDGGRSRTTSSDAEEDKKLELKLGLPGVQEEERTAGPREEIEQQQEESYTALSLGCFPAHSKLTTSTATTGAKRGFLATVGAKPEGCNQRHQDREGCGNELILGGENMAGRRKKGCCPPASSHDSVAAPLHSSSNLQGRCAVLPVVGWPPVRSFRRNLTNVSSSKQSPERQNDEAGDKAKLTCKRSPLVKINMDGIPIGRKIDLAAYDSYQKVSSAVEELFRGFLEAQKDVTCTESGEQGAEEKIFSGLLDGTGEYTLVYEDSGGGRSRVGDLPWNVFVSTAKRLRVMRSSELPHG